MPAASETSVRTLLAGTLHKNDGAAGLEDYWDGIVPNAVAESEAWLRNELSGFTSAKVNAWGMFEFYHRRLSVFFCGLYDAATMTDDQRALLQKLDCRAEVSALETLGPDDSTTTDDDPVIGGLMQRSDDLIRGPGVASNGGLAGNIFNTPWRCPVRDVR